VYFIKRFMLINCITNHRLPSSLNIGVGYEDGLFLLYREDGFILAFREAGIAPCEESLSNEASSADCRKVCGAVRLSLHIKRYIQIAKLS
jgi:hypothetical protein